MSAASDSTVLAAAIAAVLATLQLDRFPKAAAAFA
jgi:hypothetical protein